MAARGIGLVAAGRGRPQKALEWLREARRRCARLPDAYLWVEAYTLDALCSIAVAHDVQAAPAWVEELAQLAGRTGMREMLARAYGHRAQLGDASSLTAARLLAAVDRQPRVVGDPRQAGGRGLIRMAHEPA